VEKEAMQATPQETKPTKGQLLAEIERAADRLREASAQSKAAREAYSKALEVSKLADDATFNARREFENATYALVTESAV